ncbi:MAG: MBL fold metallo-hydrolase [Alphaproteobacteria bacterium]
MSEIRFWGVRGSMPAPESHAVGVGGNTTCVGFHHDDHLLIFDAGTGIQRLAKFLAEERPSTADRRLFLSHYHWDHIWGLPFHTLALSASTPLQIYGEDKGGVGVKEILGRQMKAPIFPIPIDAVGRKVSFNSIGPDTRIEVLPDLSVTTSALNHPNGAIGYRVEAPGGSLCIITDHEHPEQDLQESVIAFAQGASVLVHDAQYAPAEKKSDKAGWGHSSWEEAALTAREAGVDRLYLSHHDPARTDVELAEVVRDMRQVFRETYLATEATVLQL